MRRFLLLPGSLLLAAALTSGTARAAETSEPRRLEFSNPDGESFNVLFRVLSDEDSAATGGAHLPGGDLIRMSFEPDAGTLEIVRE